MSMLEQHCSVYDYATLSGSDQNTCKYFGVAPKLEMHGIYFK